MKVPYEKLPGMFALLTIICHFFGSTMGGNASFCKTWYMVTHLQLAKQKFNEENKKNMFDKEVFMPNLKPRKKTRVVKCGEGSKNGRSEEDSLIFRLPTEIVLQFFSRISRSEYHLLAGVNKKFKSLIGNSYLYDLRKQSGVVEYWIYLLTSMDWEAFDLVNRRWVKVPSVWCGAFFPWGSLVVGTELLAFWESMNGFQIWSYSFLTHGWSVLPPMGTIRSRFASSSQGKIAIIAGGSDGPCRVFKSAEIYNAETHIWESLPDMNMPRCSSSGFFMDGRFYVIGGKSTRGFMTCGEEYNFNTKTWRRIEGMYYKKLATYRMHPPPPLVAVVKNDLYSADESKSELKKYDKINNTWSTIGKLPLGKSYDYRRNRAAFTSYDDTLLMVCNKSPVSIVYSWRPGDGTSGGVKWSVVSRRTCLTCDEPYNCAVMGC